MSSNSRRFQIKRIPRNQCIRFELWYAGTKARRHTTETRAKAVMNAIPRSVKGSKVLEVGAGWGYLSFLLASRGAKVVSSDIQVEDITFGSQLQCINGDGCLIQFCAADATTLPFQDASFDTTISMEMIEHIPGGPERACAEFARVTRPSGFVILSTPNPIGIAQVVKNLLKKASAFRRRYSFLDYEEWFLPPAEVLAAAAKAHLRLKGLRRTGLTVPFIPNWLFPLNLLAEKALTILPVLLTTNIFIFQKY